MRELCSFYLQKRPRLFSDLCIIGLLQKELRSIHIYIFLISLFKGAEQFFTYRVVLLIKHMALKPVMSWKI